VPAWRLSWSRPASTRRERGRVWGGRGRAARARGGRSPPPAALVFILPCHALLLLLRRRRVVELEAARLEESREEREAFVTGLKEELARRGVRLPPGGAGGAPPA
jgi:hypothetical protein